MANDLDHLTVDRVTTAEKIADAVRESILSGSIKPGTPLREGSLGSTLGVSRNTIREALRLLAHDGLVTHNAFRGVRVTELSGADIVDIFRARRTLELCGVEATGSISADKLAGLVAMADARDQAVDERDWPTAFEADMQFHAIIVSLVGSARLDDFFVALLRELRLVLYLTRGLETEKLPRDRTQHRAIVRHIKRGDVEKCRAAMLEHLADSEKLLIELMMKRSTAGDAEAGVNAEPQA